MKHFIITRFNIKSDVWLHTKSGALTNTETWLEQRFMFFETYCLPSVKNQSNQAFKWLIIFDIDTPKHFKNRIETLSEAYNNMIVLFTESFQTLKRTLSEAIETEITVEDKFIISTRLDNDDAVHRDFTNSIQNVFIPKHNTIIDVTKGYQLIVNNNNYDARYYSTDYNPFISLIEDASNFETVMVKNHDQWKSLNHRIVYNEKALWLQVIHNDNILNSKINALKKVNQLDLDMFGIKDINLKNHMLKIKIFNLATWPLRLLRTSKIIFKRLIK